MKTGKTRIDFLDGFVAMVLAPYSVYAFLKSGGWANFKAQAKDAWQSVYDTLSDLQMAYARRAARWLQAVSVIFGFVFFLVTALMLVFWNKDAGGSALYQITALLSALIGIGFCFYTGFLQQAVPEYERDAQHRLIPDENTGDYRLNPSKQHRFGRISAIGLSIALMVVNAGMFLAFMVLSVLRGSTAFVVMSLPFFAVAIGVGMFYEKLTKFIAFQTVHFAKIVVTEGVDLASVVLPHKVMADFLEHHEQRKLFGEKAEASNTNVLNAVIVPSLLAVLVHLFWVNTRPGFVLWVDLCILGMTLVAIIGLKAGQEETVRKQRNFWFGNFVKFAMFVIVVAKFLEVNGYSLVNYFGRVIITSPDVWRVIIFIVVLLALAIFLFTAASKVLKDVRVLSYIMWAFSIMCFGVALANFFALINRSSIEAVAESNAKTAPAVVVASASASASTSTPPPARDEATKLAEATVNEIKQARADMQKEIDDGKQLVAVLKQVKSDRGESGPLVRPLSSGKAVAKTSSAPTSSLKSSSASTVAIVDSDAEVEAARKRLAAKYLNE